MKRKLGLILAMISQPELLFLDEISSGLDPHYSKLKKRERKIALLYHFTKRGTLKAPNGRSSPLFIHFSERSKITPN